MQKRYSAGTALLRWSSPQRTGLCLAVARGLEALRADGSELGLCGLQVGAERRVRMQPGHCACAHEVALDHVAVPVRVAYIAAFSKGPAPRE
ncbi:MAG TPA: hypothetical protein PKK79_11895, partial [Syntrophorhabdaceae bacterium]|nr:hypothetical protein [Syntrophorhabdaceae bacterium]